MGKYGKLNGEIWCLSIVIFQFAWQGSRVLTANRQAFIL
jgi:hypothetical protein